MSVLLRDGKVLSNLELFALPIDGDGWRLLPDGTRAMIGARASIGERASIGAWATIGAWASIGTGASIGERASIGAWATIGAWAMIGERARFDSSPLAVQGSRHLVTQHSAGTIAVGCEVHTAEGWLKYGERIGAKNDYTPSEIEEYRKIIAFVAANGVPVGTVEVSK